jgi:hypothetical protein
MNEKKKKNFSKTKTQSIVWWKELRKGSGFSGTLEGITDP